MKRLLASLSLVMMMCLVCISCKKDEANYPAEIKTSVWSGGNGSTGYSCDVSFMVDSSVGQYCVITTTAPGEKETGTFQGRFIYDANSGTAVVTFEETAGGPSQATLQFNDGGTQMAVSFTAANVDFGKFTVQQVLIPSSISGNWVNKEAGIEVSVKLGAFAIEGGLPCEIVAMKTMALSGLYNYTQADGKGTFKVSMPIPNGKIEYTGTFQYNSDGSLTCKIPELGALLPADGIVLIRATKK